MAAATAGPGSDGAGGAPPGERHERQRRALRPRDAATLVLVDRQGTEPRILMGRRHANQVFLPNKYVFPGGRLDRADRSVPHAGDLPEDDVRRLLHDMKGSPAPARARALALCAIRETFEETGLLIGRPAPTGAPPARSRHAVWQRFLEAGLTPCLEGLTFFARAITPPARPRRYDTRFFMGDASLVAGDCAACDEELGEIGWFTLDEVRSLDLPNITRAVVEDLAQRIACRPHASHEVAYYSFRRGAFRRDLIG